MVFQWKDGARQSADADLVGHEIAEIGKEITPQDVVEYAKDKKRELYKCFEWDDTEAAMEYRLSQARDVIGALVFVEEGEDGEAEEKQIRFYENVRVPCGDGDSRRAYVPITKALKDDGLRVQVFARLESVLHDAEDTIAVYEYLSNKLTAAREKVREARKVLA
jgi:hypothetical protein